MGHGQFGVENGFSSSGERGAPGIICEKGSLTLPSRIQISGLKGVEAPAYFVRGSASGKIRITNDVAVSGLFK